MAVAGIRFRGLKAQAQRIADEIRHILDFRDLVIVCEDDGLAFFLQRLDFFGEVETEIYTNAYHRLISALPMSLQTKDLQYRLGFIGGGKLAGSVMRGLLRAKFCAPAEILVSEPNDEARAALRDELRITVTVENAEVAEKAEIILIGVKPGVVLEVVD